MYVYRNASYYLTKKQLKKSFLPVDNAYAACEYTNEYTKDLVNCTFEAEKTYTVFSKDNRKGKVKTIPTLAPMLYGIRRSGSMFTYDQPSVPFSVYLVGYENGLSLRFYASTIDDASMSFFLNVTSMEDYVKKLQKVKAWTETFSEMPGYEEFEEYWRKEGALDFDYN